MRIFLFIPLLSVFLFSCEKEVNIPIPQQEPKLAVSCFISPGDTAVVVYVFLSNPVFAVADSTGNLVQNATVVFSNGSSTFTLPYDPNTGSYHAGIAVSPITWNATYYLGVTDAQGRHVSAKTTTPSALFPSFDASQAQTSSDDNLYIRYEVNCRINDISGEENYYRVSSASVFYHAGSPDTLIDSDRTNAFINDRANDGGTLTAGIKVFSGAGDTATYRARRVILTKCDKNFYNFHLSVNSANNSNGNPFAEPTIIYSNIDGGYGCFGAYMMQYKDIPY